MLDEEIQEVMEANRALWEKVGEISSFVKVAIQKANEIRKNGRQKQEKTEDPQLKEKNDQIRQY